MYVHEYWFSSYSRACLHITYDMIYVIHGNKITFIVIVIVISQNQLRLYLNITLISNLAI